MDTLYFKLVFLLMVFYTIVYIGKDIKLIRNGYKRYQNKFQYTYLGILILIVLIYVTVNIFIGFDMTEYGTYPIIAYIIIYLFLGQIWYNDKEVYFVKQRFDLELTYEKVKPLVDDIGRKRIRVVNEDGTSGTIGKIQMLKIIDIYENKKDKLC
jgi:hypothetical protein